MSDLLVFTDLDGSLLNHEDYSCQEALPAISRLRARRIPLIFVTSKTRGEVEVIQQEIGIREPFIVENGGGIFIPASYRGWTLTTARAVSGYSLIELGVGYGRIRAFLAKFGGDFGIKGFGDWTVGEIAEKTGLDTARAALARVREFTEPFLPAPDADMKNLQRLAAEHGLKITRGGRFFHLIGAGQDKGAAVRTLRRLAGNQSGPRPLAIGIGDSENDLPMLQEVDIPVVIPRPDGSCLDLSLPRLVVAAWPGSRGWNGAVEEILDEFAPTAA